MTIANHRATEQARKAEREAQAANERRWQWVADGLAVAILAVIVRLLF